MADDKATFAVELVDQTSGAAGSARDALAKLKGSIDSDIKALASMQRAMKNLQSGTSVNVDAFRELQKRIDAQKSSIADAQAKYVQLGGSFKVAGAAGKDFAGLGDRVKKIPGPIGDASRKLGDLKEALGGVSLGAVAVGVGVVAALGAVFYGVGKLFTFAINSTDALRSRATRSGGPVMSLGRQLEHMKRDFGKLFSGLNLGPFLRGMRVITSMFSQTTATGRALKTLIELIFQPLLDGAGRGAPIMKRFFQGIIIAALHVAIIVLELRKKFRETFGDVEIFRGLDFAKVALYAGMAAVGLFVLALAPLVIALGIVAVQAYAIYRAFSVVLDFGSRFFRALKREGTSAAQTWREIGPELVDGLVDGITGAANRAYEAVRNLGGSMADALKEALDIHSPSRVFAELGIQIPRGVQQGVTRGSQELNRSVAEMVVVPPAPAPTSGSKSSAPTSATTITFGDIHVHGDVADPRATATSIVDQVAELLKGVSITMGVPA